MSTRAHAVSDSATMLRRNLRHALRYPSMSVSVVAMPVIFLLLFVYVFGGTLGAGLGGAPGGGRYIDYVVPGIILLTAATASMSTAVSVCVDMTEGIVARFRTMAIFRPALLTGHVVGSMILTMVQLADYAGVTVRAVRHYHQRGLLAEPARDASGYRRYDASAVVDLIRIKTLAKAGVPLARIEELLSAGPGQFTQAIAHIDKAMAARIRDLKQHRRQLAELTGGERLFLPADVVDLLDQLRAMGVSQRAVQLERDGWILAVALSPERVLEWLEQKRSALASAEFRQLYLTYDQAFDWDPDDPRLAELADATVAYAVAQQPEAEHAQPDWTAGEHAILALLESQVGNSSPSWERLNELGKARLRASGYPDELT